MSGSYLVLSPASVFEPCLVLQTSWFFFSPVILSGPYFILRVPLGPLLDYECVRVLFGPFTTTTQMFVYED